MPILSLAAVARDIVNVRGEIPLHDSGLAGLGLELTEPLRVDLEARMVGEGVLVRGDIEAELAGECRRCLVAVPIRLHDTVDLLYEPLSAAEEAELNGEVYPLPERGDELDLKPALREQVMLRIPDFVVCSETCRGLCPQCGAELNRTACDCVPGNEPGPWDALKDIKFD
ncbi:MAG: DUF177 domain-containing protein [Gemmatimonadota bacterium]